MKFLLAILLVLLNACSESDGGSAAGSMEVVEDSLSGMMRFSVSNAVVTRDR